MAPPVDWSESQGTEPLEKLRKSNATCPFASVLSNAKDGTTRMAPLLSIFVTNNPLHRLASRIQHLEGDGLEGDSDIDILVGFLSNFLNGLITCIMANQYIHGHFHKEFLKFHLRFPLLL